MGVFSRTIHQFAPSWFQAPYMGTLMGAVAGTLDDFVDRVFLGMRSANPYAAGARAADGTLLECDPEALEYHARDRAIRLYDTEPTLSQRYRLSQWHQLKRQRGSPLGILHNLQPFWKVTELSVLPTIRIVHQSNDVSPVSTWETISPDGSYSVIRYDPGAGSNWNYDGQSVKRARFWVIIHLPPGYSSAIYYDDGVSVYDGGAIYDGLRAAAIADMVGAIKEAKAAHSKLAGLIITEIQPDDLIPGGGGEFAFDPSSPPVTLPDGSTSLPVGNWQSSVDPVTNLPTRPPWAAFVYEDN